MNIKQLKKELGLSGKQIAEFFGYSNYLSFRNSSAKKRIEAGLCSFYAFVKSKEGGKNIKTNNSSDVD
jgi:transcriptional regulator with XRE-family HTH domain